MFNNISRMRLIGMWCAAVAVVSACSVVGGLPLTTSMGEVWLVGCLAPPAVMLLVWPMFTARTLTGKLGFAFNFFDELRRVAPATKR